MVINKRIAETLIVPYHVVQNAALRQEHHDFHWVDYQFIPTFEIRVWKIARQPMNCSSASRTIGGDPRLFCNYRWPFAWYCDSYSCPNLLHNNRAAIDTCGLRNRVACTEEPLTMQGARHTADCQCIHKLC